MSKLYLSNNDLSQFKWIGNASKAPKTLNKRKVTYNLAGKYSVAAKHNRLIKFKAYLAIIFSLGLALTSEKVREARKGRKIKIVYIQKNLSPSTTESMEKSSKKSLPFKASSLPPKASEVSSSNSSSSSSLSVEKAPPDNIKNPLRVLSTNFLLSELLNVDGFVKEGGDHEYRDKLYNYGEVQGSQKLREAAALIAKFNPELFSTDNLRNLNNIDPQLYRILQFKRIGHAFGLIGDIPFPNDYTLALVGFSETFTVSLILSSFKAFMEANRDSYDNWTDEDTKRINEVYQNMLFQETFTEGDLDQAIETLNKGSKEDVVAFSTGFAWHVTQSFYLGEFYINANRGAGCIQPGFDVYQRKGNAPYTRESITDISNRHTILNDGINIRQHFRDNGWDMIHTEPMSGQKVGNCSYTSVKAGLRFLLSWRHYCKSPDAGGQPFSYCDQTKKMYKDWSRFDRELQIKDLLVDLEKLKRGEIEAEYIEPIKQLYTLVVNSNTIIKNKIAPELIQELVSYQDFIFNRDLI